MVVFLCAVLPTYRRTSPNRNSTQTEEWNMGQREKEALKKNRMVENLSFLADVYIIPIKDTCA